jgi:outer membrane protein assembly factor BamB
MWRKLKRFPRARFVLPLVVGLLLVGGVVSAYTRLDLKRFHGDTLPMGRLARAAILPTEPNRSGAADWPQWRGPNRDGVVSEARLPAWPREGPRLLWKKPIGRGFSAVVAAAGRIYTMAEEADATNSSPTAENPGCEVVLCWDAATGQEVWRFAYPSRFEERFGPGPRSTPAVDGHHVYTVGATGILHCLRADTGAMVWRHDLRVEYQAPAMQYGVAFSPLVEGDLVFTMPGGRAGNAVAAFDKHTGVLRWKALDNPVGYSSPVAATLAGVRQVLFLTNTELISLAPATGEVYWRYPWKTENGFNIATPVVIGDYVFVSSAYGKGCALLEIASGAGGTMQARLVYEHNRMRNYFATSVRCGEHLYGFDLTDLVCMDIRTGKCLWGEKSNRRFKKGSLLTVGGDLVILGEYGTLALAEATPTGYHERAAFQLSEHKCWTVPSVAHGRLYVRDEADLFCYDLRVKAATVASR